MSFDTSDLTIDNNNSNEKNENDVIVIKQEELTPINNPECKHYFIKDNDELAEENNMQSWICKKCKRGTFLPKDKTIINS